MSTTMSKMTENEVMFRQFNEKIQNGFKELEKAAIEENQIELLKNHDDNLHFYCECADEKCIERIVMKPSKYESLHKTYKEFVILPGHAVPKLERRIKKTKKYEVVEKVLTPPSHAEEFHSTNLHNQ